MESTLVVLLGILAGTVAGMLPGIGVTVTLLMSMPLLQDLNTINLLLFYLSVACTVQFTGTIPSVYLGFPGETNSMPAVVEGTKFRRRQASSLAIGLCGIGSVFGSVVAVAITFLLLSYLVPLISGLFSDVFRLSIYLLVIVIALFLYNRNLILNLLLLLFGFWLSMIGEPPLETGFRFTFGISHLEYGIPYFPVLVAFLAVPSLFSPTVKNFKIIPKEKLYKLSTVFLLFFRNISSALRGSVIGYFCGMVPGTTTTLSTNMSYAVEKKTSRLYPTKLITSAETANNAGMFSSILPLILLGIPISTSEVVLFSLLVDSGWSPYQFDNLEANTKMIFTDLTPWFIVINAIALMIAWPYAKSVIRLFNKINVDIKYITLSVCVLINFYLGYTQSQTLYYGIVVLVLGTIGYLLRGKNCLPLVFMFILGNDIESIVSRIW